MLEKTFTRIINLGFIAAAAVYIVGWFINVMDVDAAQYAAMSLEMLKSGNFLTITDHGKDYLDKPPLIFWMSGLSMSIFGANNVAYRIPAFLATILAIYSTYRFTKLYYSKETALLSALILATLQATFLINHDVRTDTNLMACYVFSLWQLAEYLENKRWSNFIAGFIGVGFAMLAKGPIGLIAPAMAIFGHLFLKKEWKVVFNPKWLTGILIIAVILTPMSYGLYTQFDLHPEKLVNGKTGVSGLRFFYWTQSFGRITGESEWDNHADPFFLSHSTLWAFAPWSVFLVLGLADRFKSLFKNLLNGMQVNEFITLSGFVLPFAALSLSKYQLPHYAFVVYPLGAVITADYILRTFYTTNTRWSKSLYIFQIFILYLTLGLILGLIWYPFPDENHVALVMFTVLLVGFSWVAFSKNFSHRLISVCIIFIIGVNLILNSYFYPNILKFQAGSQLGIESQKEEIPHGNFYSYLAGVPNSLNFYSGYLVKETDDFDALVSKKNCLVFTRLEQLQKFKTARPDLEIIQHADNYSVTMLRGKFLNPLTREQTLEKRVLIRL